MLDAASQFDFAYASLRMTRGERGRNPSLVRIKRYEVRLGSRMKKPKAVFASGSLSAKAKKAPYWVPFALKNILTFRIERYSNPRTDLKIRAPCA